MNVLVCSHMYPNAARPHLGVFVREQVKWLASAHAIDVVSPVPWLPIDVPGTRFTGFKAIPYESLEAFHGASWRVVRPQYPIVPASWGYTLEWLSQYASVRPLRSSFAPDVVHAHGLLPDGFVGWQLARHFRVPLVLTWHGFYNFAGPFRQLARQILKHASAVIYVGTPLQKNIGRYTEVGRTFRLLGNGSDGYALPRAPVPSSVATFARGRPILLSVAFLIERKGHRVVLDALRYLKDQGRSFAYVIVGDGPERARLEAYAAQLGLQDDVLFEGNVEHAQLWGYFDACDLFVLPSWDEAFGVVYAEALSRRRVVIGCIGEGAQDIADLMGGTVLVPARDVDALARAIERVLFDANERRALETTIRPDAMTWRSIASEISNIYREITHK